MQRFFTLDLFVDWPWFDLKSTLGNLRIPSIPGERSTKSPHGNLVQAYDRVAINQKVGHGDAFNRG